MFGFYRVRPIGKLPAFLALVVLASLTSGTASAQQGARIEFTIVKSGGLVVGGQFWLREDLCRKTRLSDYDKRPWCRLHVWGPR